MYSNSWPLGFLTAGFFEPGRVGEASLFGVSATTSICTGGVVDRVDPPWTYGVARVGAPGYPSPSAASNGIFHPLKNTDTLNFSGTYDMLCVCSSLANIQPVGCNHSIKSPFAITLPLGHSMIKPNECRQIQKLMKITDHFISPLLSPLSIRYSTTIRHHPPLIIITPSLPMFFSRKSGIVPLGASATRNCCHDSHMTS